jgi:putative membrane protein
VTDTDSRNDLNTEKSRHYGLLFLRGMAMGAADVVPGVSGGTVAFITGIYEELIRSLQSCDHRALKILFSEGLPAAWRHINGSFLLTLLAGIALSAFSLANVVSYCLDVWPIQIWSFFFGLVLAASIHMFQQIDDWALRRVLQAFTGLGVALLISQLRPAELPGDWWVLMAGGAIAICAMILPGISGGFLLLIMGLYPIVIQAVAEMNISLLAVFVAGCGIGLLAFSHVLGWLLQRFHDATLAVLTGFLAGSLMMLWPWRVTLESVVDRHGETRPLVQTVVSPWRYEELTAEPSLWHWALLFFAIGVILVLGAERLQQKKDVSNFS